MLFTLWRREKMVRKIELAGRMGKIAGKMARKERIVVSACAGPENLHRGRAQG